jgi:hypothetical protein
MDGLAMHGHGAGFTPQTIPEQGFERIVRVSYCEMNATNPIGGTVQVEQDLHYTGSVG